MPLIFIYFDYCHDADAADAAAAADALFSADYFLLRYDDCSSLLSFRFSLLFIFAAFRAFSRLLMLMFSFMLSFLHCHCFSLIFFCRHMALRYCRISLILPPF